MSFDIKIEMMKSLEVSYVFLVLFLDLDLDKMDKMTCSFVMKENCFDDLIIFRFMFMNRVNYLFSWVF